MAAVIVTGGAGFIGSSLVRFLVGNTGYTVVNLDKLTYAGNLDSLRMVENHPRYQFEKADICDGPALKQIFEKYSPSAIFHLAAESHVDRSIDSPGDFIRTNVEGTFTLLQTSLHHWSRMERASAEAFRFLHVSTDEVFGSLGPEGLFTETSPYDPHSPYSASKAASDHLARAWHHTYKLPVIVTNCSNNYGPYQFPEKLIPVVITKALRKEKIPVYGKGENVRDWLFVEDHVQALFRACTQGNPGETYNVGGSSECTNLLLVKKICALLDQIVENAPAGGFGSLISFVTDRPGHDHRYAIDASKIERELGWKPSVSLDAGLKLTIEWYLKNQEWCERVASGKYRQERLGLRREGESFLLR